MRKKLTLKEELNRMKGLMVYTNGNHKNPIMEDDKEGIKPGPSYKSGDLNIKFQGGKSDIKAAGGLPKIKEEADKLKKWLKENPKLKNRKIQININAGSSNYWRTYLKHDSVLKKADDQKRNENLTKARGDAGVAAIRKHFPKADWPNIKISPVYNANIGDYWGDVRKAAIDKAKGEGKSGAELNPIIFAAYKNWIKENKKNQYVSITAGVSSEDDTPEPEKCICTNEETGEKTVMKRLENGECPECPGGGKEKEPCEKCPDGTIPERDENGDCKECEKEPCEKCPDGTIPERDENGDCKECEEPEPIKEEIEKCFKRNSIFTIEYGKKQQRMDHHCTKAVWEVFANGIKLKRRTNKNKLVDYVSLNNTNRLADDATQTDGKYGGIRTNIVKLSDIDINEFVNEEKLKEYKGNLVIELKCISGTGKWPAHGSTGGCHKDVAGISYMIDGELQNAEFTPPYGPGDQKEVYTIPACVKKYKELVEKKS